MYRRCNDEAIVVADVGQNQIWAALWFDYEKPGLFLNSGGTGCMGYAFPAAIGAKFARPDKTVELRQIKTGITRGNVIQVVQGLKPGEIVVTKGSLFVDQAAGS